MNYVKKLVELPIGATVKVREDCHCSEELRGATGTIMASYGQPGYAAFDVLLENGVYELFWQYELTEAEETVTSGRLAG